jgi:hypothetical protein
MYNAALAPIATQLVLLRIPADAPTATHFVLAKLEEPPLNDLCPIATLSVKLLLFVCPSAFVPIATLRSLSSLTSPNAAFPIATLSSPFGIYHAASEPIAIFLSPSIRRVRGNVPIPIFLISLLSPLAITFTSIIPEYFAGSMVASFYSTN